MSVADLNRLFGYDPLKAVLPRHRKATKAARKRRKTVRESRRRNRT